MTPLPLGGGGKVLVLGTVHWGLNIDKPTAHALLDRFAASGGGIVDTAPNYPINKNPASYQAAISYLAEWLQVNRHSGLSVIVRLGSCDNEGGPDALLNPSFISLSAEVWEGALYGALGCLAVHYDNRDDPSAISQTVHAFRLLHEQGLAIGLSSVRRPDLYAAAAPEMASSWVILGAENEEADETLATYRPHFPHAACLAYAAPAEPGNGDEVQQLLAAGRPGRALPEGMMAELRDILPKDRGGVPGSSSLDAWQLPRVLFIPDLEGAIVSPGSAEQLDHFLNFWKRFEEAAGSTGAALAERARKTAHCQ